MADENWPIPAFHFQVDFDGTQVSFQEVSGLEVETETIEYRAGDDIAFSTQSIPGLRKYTPLSFKKGVFIGDQQLWEWWNQVKPATHERMEITITLLDEEQNPVVSWVAHNAYVSKMNAPELNAQSSDIAIESIEVAHEGLEQQA